MQQHFYGSNTPATQQNNKNIAQIEPQKNKQNNIDLFIDLCETCERKREVFINQILENSQHSQMINNNKDLLYFLP